MRAAGNAVLFGTDSFWSGVDVPGDALSQVVITRLPFEVPTHPVAEARAEWIRERGGNPFNELTLPEALVKFRQGIGRLIRTQTDRGLVTILDSRVLAKAYGRLFLESLPKRDFQRITRENRAERFKPFP
jgi:ATP-dependent DNA helicase DinG